MDSVVNLCFFCVFSDLLSFCGGGWGEGAGESDKGEAQIFRTFFTLFLTLFPHFFFTDFSQIRTPVQAQVQSCFHTCQAQKKHT